jgi:hypothetical protein
MSCSPHSCTLDGHNFLAFKRIDMAHIFLETQYCKGPEMQDPFYVQDRNIRGFGKLIGQCHSLLCRTLLYTVKTDWV